VSKKVNKDGVFILLLAWKSNPGVFRMSTERLTLREIERVVINGVKFFVPLGCSYGEPK
jgi:hypothetical protein